MITIDGGTGIIRHNGVEIASDKMHDQWVIESSTSAEGFTDNIPTSWTRSSLSYAATYLTGMSHSSGVFTFPKTGIYRVDFRLGYYKNDSHKRYVGALIELSTDGGSSYGDAGRSYTHLYDVDGNNTFNTSIVYSHINVQNASTYRIRFRIPTQSDVTIYGDTDDVRTAVQFERLSSST